MTVGQWRGASSGRTHERGDAFAKQGDGLHEFCVRERGDVHLETEPRDAAESGAVFEDFLRDFIGAADEERAIRRDPVKRGSEKTVARPATAMSTAMTDTENHGFAFAMNGSARVTL